MARRNKHKKELKEAKVKIRQLTAEGGWVVGKDEHVQCTVCRKMIKPGKVYRRIPPDEKVPEWRYYHVPECAPGTEAWRQFHPSHLAELLMIGKEVKAEKRLRRRMRKMGKPLTSLTEKGEIIMTKKAGKKGEHLKPMAPVVIPESIIKKQSKEVRDLIGKLNALKDRSSKEGATIRKSLRKAGFKLSDYREGNGKKEAPPKKEKKSRKEKAGVEDAE